MPQKQTAERIFFPKPVASPAGKRDADLAFSESCQEIRDRLRMNWEDFMVVGYCPQKNYSL